MTNRYDKMPDYITSVYNVFQMVNRKSQEQRDKKMRMIGLIIYNYVNYTAKQYNLDLKSIVEPDKINLIPIFEYIAANDVELFDFKTIQINDIDIHNKNDLERFVLTHIYYITQ